MFERYKTPKLALVVGVAIFLVLFFICLAHAIPKDSTDYDHPWLKAETKIQIENASPKAKIFYWVYWNNPVDEYGKPLRDYRGFIITKMNIMGGELKPGATKISDNRYRPGEYELQWREAYSGLNVKKTEFTLEPGLDVYLLTVYSSWEEETY